MRRALLRRTAGERGFSLIEVMVALTLLTIVAAAAIPLLLSAASAARTSKYVTQSKSLAQQRVEQMRNLPFHVDAAPSYPRVDLLDLYFPDLSASSGTTIKTVTSGLVTTQTRLPGEPTTGTFYRRVITNLGTDFAKFRQVVATQYLDKSRKVIAPDATYNRLAEGFDVPPSQFVGITVLTAYEKSNGSMVTYRLFSEIADGRAPTPEMASEARASALRITSEYNGAQLVSEAGIISAEGARANGATASFSAQGGLMFMNPGTTVKGAELVKGGPPDVALSSAVLGRRSILDGDLCTIACFGRTRVDNGYITVAGSLPRVGTSTAPITSGVVRESQGFRYNNGSSSGFDPALALRPGESVVRVTESDETNLARSTAYLDATPNGSGHLVRAVTTTRTELVQLFPTTFTPIGRSVVEVELKSASLSCLAGTGGPVATGAFEATVRYFNWATQTYVTLPTIAQGGTDVLASYDPALIQVGPTQRLSDYISSWSNLTGATTTIDGTSVTSSLEGIVAITTAPTRTGDFASTIGVRIGSLSCYAEDTRP